MRKAKELENEMRQIKLKKQEVVVRQFEAQLLKEAESEEKRYIEELRDKYEQQLNTVEAERKAAQDEMQKMQRSLLDQIEFFKMVFNEIEGKKSELSSTYQACVQYLRREMQQAQEQQR